jgi:hypothetical protein
MNQKIADAIRALPSPLWDTYIVGWLYILLSFLCYAYYIRPALWRYIRAHASPKTIDTMIIRPSAAIFFTPLRKKAHLDACGWYTVNRLLLPALLVGLLLHLCATILHLTLPTPPALLQSADCAMLSLLFCTVAILSLISQPAATQERRTRWGFRPFGNTVHAVIWEGIILFLLFLWLYIAYFLSLL